MGKITRSWIIFKNSLTILKANKKLLLFPVLSTGFIVLLAILIFSSVFAAGFFVPNESAEKLSATTQQSSVQTNAPAVNPAESKVESFSRPVEIILLFAAYFVSVFMATFFNTAFYSEILHGLKWSRSR